MNNTNMNPQQIAEQLRNLARLIELTSEQHCAVDAVLNEEVHATSNPDPYAELKVARAAGKVIQTKDEEGWFDDANPKRLKHGNYRIKPDFQLPPPPPGKQWHREDGWTAEMLPQGYRPLIEGEKLQRTYDSFTHTTYPQNMFVVVLGLDGQYPANPKGSFYRTTRPLAFTHEGKQWTWHRPGDPCPCGEHESVTVLYNNPVQEYIGTPYPAHCFAWKNPSGLTPIIGWRYADEPKMVELGPEDVTPLSIIRRKSEEQNWHWRLVSYVDAVKVTCADRGYPWTELATDYEINRSLPLTGKWNPNAWEPCHKLAP